MIQRSKRKTKIPFYSFRQINLDIETKVKQAFQDVFHSGWYLLGDHLDRFERSLSNYLGVNYTVGVGSGLDALIISLKSLGIGKGDKVILPAHTFYATVLSVMHTGAQPVLADSDPETLNMDPLQAERFITGKTKVFMPVHLYGLPCPMDTFLKLSNAYNIQLVEDFAQSVGASYNKKKCGSFGKINACSFYPVKTLGAFGDGGAITTNDPGLAGYCRKFRNYGSDEKYYFEEAGLNSRLDEIQAAILNEKLRFLDRWIQQRIKIASMYLENLKGIGDIRLPLIQENSDPVWHIFPIRTNKRDQLQNFLIDKGIETLIHYPVPVHLQKSFQKYIKTYKAGDFPVAEEIAATELSLPIYPGLTDDEIYYIIESITSFFDK